jgi:2-C-methyl-D-erythritol 4-phosphate cytidylyltransferase
MKKFALIVAGGSGNRMKGRIPKQFIELNDQPILIHTFERFQNYDPEIEFILVLPKRLMEFWKDLCEKYQFKIEHKLALGGKTRFQSVKNGLELVSEEGIVFIHDGVRPLVSVQTIHNCFDAAMIKGNALPVIPVNESVRVIDSEENRPVDRSKYFLVQTPQTFQSTLIKQAYGQTLENDFTDDATVLEQYGQKIKLVEGNRENIKITWPEDVIIAQALMRMKM